MQESNAAQAAPSAVENVSAKELEKCLKVGMDVFLDASPGTPHSRRFPASVRGWEAGRYLILSLQGGVIVPSLRQGRDCAIRFMHGGEVWGFTAAFSEQMANSGYPVLQFYWPDEVARVQVRRHERVEVDTPCTVDLDDDSSVSAIIVDISGGGCSIVMEKELEVGATLRLSFRMPDGGSVNQRPVIVRNRRAVLGRGLKYGCQFQQHEEKDHGIELFVARKIAVERGEKTPHPQILILSRSGEDIETAQRVLADTPFEVVEAAGILDLGYRLRTCAAKAILISFDQKELSALEIISLIKQSSSTNDLLLFLYGSSTLREQAMTSGATLWLASISDIRQILSYLPEPEPESSPTHLPTVDSGTGAADAIPDVTGSAMDEMAMERDAVDDGEIKFEE